jgi:hypothetical protein
MYLVQDWITPLMMSKEKWIEKYDLDPTKAVIKKTTVTHEKD